MVPESIRHRLPALVRACKAASNIREIPGIKKLKGAPDTYRLRLGDYRIIIFVEGDSLEMSHIAHRKDVYKHFP
jgi:mRNA-degrading endonuclease RelE of RelBE toxin-antitoxin system